jgi:hypothetical protein
VLVLSGIAGWLTVERALVIEPDALGELTFERLVVFLLVGIG